MPRRVQFTRYGEPKVRQVARDSSGARDFAPGIDAGRVRPSSRRSARGLRLLIDRGMPQALGDRGEESECVGLDGRHLLGGQR